MLKFMLDANIYVIRRRPIEVLATLYKFAGTLFIRSITETSGTIIRTKRQLFGYFSPQQR
ncbi:hypothetical protein [Rheinheimera sp.]|uniref:hypothetical protein n=1 Tax=Rheinheimera sp. TaxID=1869214 RepID=UPI003D2DD101